MMYFVSRLLPLTSVALLAFAASGCEALDDMNPTGGNSEKGYFQITPEADLAKGAKLTFSIGDYESFSGSKSGVDLEAPKSSDTNVVTVQSHDDEGSVVLKGVDEGSASISFSARADGDRIDDEFLVRVTEVTKLSLAPCVTNGAYARGKKAQIRYMFNEGAKRKVLGRGLYPFSVSPSSSMTLDKSGSDENYFAFEIDDDAADEIEVRSKISGDDEKLVLPVVDENEIEGLVALNPTSTVAGATIDVDLRPIVNGRPLCSKIRKVFRSLNTHACTIDGATDGELDTTAFTATVLLNAVDACQLLVEFPDISRSFAFETVYVTEPPRSSGGSSIDFDD
ncbi:MAG: hypothetical protein QM784_33975 [Polyangiaceae bacterium]